MVPRQGQGRVVSEINTPRGDGVVQYARASHCKLFCLYTETYKLPVVFDWSSCCRCVASVFLLHIVCR